MDPEEKLRAIEAIINRHVGCMCGHFDSCEVCNPYSAYNFLADGIGAVLSGRPKARPNIEDYGKSIKIELPG